MKKFITIILAAALIVGCTVAVVAIHQDASAADPYVADPVISQSYLEGTIIPSIENRMRSAIDGSLGAVYINGIYRAGQMAAEYNLKRAVSNDGLRETLGSVRLKKGDVLTLEAGSSFVVQAGTGFALGNLSNVTAGTAVGDGDYLPQDQSCMAAAEGCGFTVASETLLVSVGGPYRLAVSGEIDYNSAADALSTMGLFKGDSSGYSLERAATRTEALVMFIRLLGEEDDALAFSGTHPFTDVDSWADCYVAYAYSMGYTRGISDTLFGASNPVAAADYMTFLMRALGYSENSDFTWKTAVDDAVSLGLINSVEAGVISGSFLRSHVAYISYYALYAAMADGETALLQKLMDDGAVSNVAAAAAKVIGARAGT